MTKTAPETNRYNINPLALEMLVCPLTKTQLGINRTKTELISIAARVAFPINKGVPLLCLSEARTLSDEEIEKFKH